MECRPITRKRRNVINSRSLYKRFPERLAFELPLLSELLFHWRAAYRTARARCRPVRGLIDRPGGRVGNRFEHLLQRDAIDELNAATTGKYFGVPREVAACDDISAICLCSAMTPFNSRTTATPTCQVFQCCTEPNTVGRPFSAPNPRRHPDDYHPSPTPRRVRRTNPGTFSFDGVFTSLSR